MKYLAQYIWWPHNNWQIYFHGINCSECTMAGKNLKTITPNSQISELPPLLELNEELTRYTLFNKSRPRILLYKSGFKIFCDSNNFKIIFCTVGDHRSNGLLENLQILKTVNYVSRTTKMYITKRRIKNYLEPTIILSIQNQMFSL